MTDSIADMLTRIRNGLTSKKTEVLIPFSKIKYALAKVFEKENFIADVEIVNSLKKGHFKEIKVSLKYQNNQPIIIGIQRISRPGCRTYFKVDEIKRSDHRTKIFSTSRGLMTAVEAKKRKLGGEALCEIW